MHLHDMLASSFRPKSRLNLVKKKATSQKAPSPLPRRSGRMGASQAH
jgi:hypothetical protein